MNSLPEVTIINLGLVDYKEAWDIQENYFRQAIDRKIAIRNGENLAPPSNYLILCVVTAMGIDPVCYCT